MNHAKVHIFDQDGTLYSRKTAFADRISKRTRAWLQSYVKVPDETAESLRLKFPNFTDVLSHLGLTLGQWHQEVLDPLSNPCEEWVDVNQPLVDLLNRIEGKKYVVSFSSAKLSHVILSRMGVRDLLEEVYNLKIPSKAPVYRKILTREQVDPKAVVIYGDNVKMDLMPGQELGCRTHYIDPDQCISKQI